MTLARLLAPRSVAVVGATERPAAYGSEALLNLSRWGYAGRVYAVNPGRETVHDVPCFATLGDLPEAPDAVIVAVPAEAAPAVVEEAGSLGCGGAVVFAAGFAEAREGERQRALAEAAARHALPVCGPNGNGIVSLGARAPLWGDMAAPQEAGPVALISESGNVAVNALGSRRGLRLHTVVSCGNRGGVTPEEWVEALAEADRVRSIALYLEDDGDGAAWCAAFERCAGAGVGVAVLKAGSSPAGAAAARAHTAALAGDQRVWRAFAEECGAAWASDPDELLELAKALAVGRRPTSPGVAMMTCSGGDASIAADLATDAGVTVPPLAPATVAALEAVLPPEATPQNPLDYTALLWGEPEPLAAIVSALAADPGVGQVLVIYDRPADLDGAAAESWSAVLDGIRSGARESGACVGVTSTLPELCDDETSAALQADGVWAAAGLRAGLRCAAALSAPAPDPARIAEMGAAARRIRVAAGNGVLSEHAAKQLCAGAGLPVTPGRLVRHPLDAIAAFEELGGPVALKLSSPGLRHKSEAGALALDVRDQTGVLDAADRLLQLGDEVLVERMAPPGAELLVAARADSIVPVLVVGLGGIWTEALDDVAIVPLPASADRLERALRSLRGAAVLTGARGRPPLDVATAAATAAAAGRLLLDHGLEQLELNPVIVHERSVTIADAVAQGGPA